MSKGFDVSNFQPFGDKVIVEIREVEEETITQGKLTLIVPKEASPNQDKMKIGTIVAIGAGVVTENENEKINIGDEVYFSNFSGCDLPTSIIGKKYRSIRFIELYGKYTPEPENQQE